jgi:hypothetical protein
MRLDATIACPGTICVMRWIYDEYIAQRFFNPWSLIFWARQSQHISGTSRVCIKEDQMPVFVVLDWIENSNIAWVNLEISACAN